MAKPTVWKFDVKLDDDTIVDMPQGAQVLSVQLQHGVPCVWALVDSDRPKVERRFSWRGTGHPCDGLVAKMFVGSIQMHGGSLIFHLFDRGER